MGCYALSAGGDVVQSAGTTAIVLLEVWRREHSRARLDLGLEVKIFNSSAIIDILDVLLAPTCGEICCLLARQSRRVTRPMAFFRVRLCTGIVGTSDPWWRHYEKPTGSTGVWVG